MHSKSFWLEAGVYATTEANLVAQYTGIQLINIAKKEADDTNKWTNNKTPTNNDINNKIQNTNQAPVFKTPHEKQDLVTYQTIKKPW